MIRLEKVRIDLPAFSVDDVDLSIDSGDFFTLLGPTGAGKTLLLEAIGGLVPITSGRILIGKRDITSLPPEKRRVGIVYQDHALFPHLTVRQNIAFGLRYCDCDNRTEEDRLKWILNELNLTHLASRTIHHLSGGERQRVALARALVVRPAVLLLDEPLSSLDPNFREEIRIMLKGLHRELGMTFLMVTHDFAEALFLAQRAAVINKGRIEQVGDAAEIFRKPTSAFVAEFVGMKNVFPAVFREKKARLGDIQLQLKDIVPPSKKYVAVRPEDVAISTDGSSGVDNILSATVVGVANHGLYHEVLADAGGIVFLVLITKNKLLEMALTRGSGVYVNIEASCIHTF
jgi:molybdate/tungstate transport system ATP-binding protein